MNPEHYLRINFVLEDNLAIDDIKTVPALMDQGINDFYKNETNIKNLLSWSNKKGNNRKKSR